MGEAIGFRAKKGARKAKVTAGRTAAVHDLKYSWNCRCTKSLALEFQMLCKTRPIYRDLGAVPANKVVEEFMRREIEKEQKRVARLAEARARREKHG